MRAFNRFLQLVRQTDESLLPEARDLLDSNLHFAEVVRKFDDMQSSIEISE